MQILPPNRNPFVDTLGDVLGTGLRALAEHKIGKMHNQRRDEAFHGAGLAKEEISLLRQFDHAPKQQLELLRLLSASKQQQQQSPLQSLGQPQQATFQGQQAQAAPRSVLQQGVAGVQPQAQAQGVPMQQEAQKQSVLQRLGSSASRGSDLAGLSPAQQVSNQRRIDKANQPFKEDLRKREENSYFLVKKAKEALALIESKKTRSGLKGLLPLAGSSPETRALDKVYKDIVGRLAAKFGTTTEGKLRFAEASKPSMDQPLETQKYLLKSMLEEETRPLEQGKIAREIIKANQGRQPEDLEGLVQEEYLRQIQDKEGEPQQEGAFVPGQVRGAPQAQQAGSDESILGKALRGGVRSISRGVVEPILGSAGNVLAGGLGLANYLSGGSTPQYSDIQAKLPISLPTSEQVAQGASRLTGGYTEPRSETESAIDNVVSTIGSIFSPGAFVGKLAKTLTKAGELGKKAKITSQILLPFSGATPLKRAVGLGLAGEAGAATAEALDAGPAGQALSKIAFMAAAGATGPRKGLEQLRAAENNAAKEAFKDQTVNINNTAAKIKNLQSRVRNSATPDRELFEEIADSANNALSTARKNGGDMPVNEIIKLKQDLNKYYKRTLTQTVQGARHLPESVRGDLRELIDIVKEPIAQASQVNPVGGKSFALMEDITRGLSKVDEAKAYIKDNLSFSTKWSAPVKAIFLGGPGYVNAVQNVLRTKPAQMLYGKALYAAAKQNGQAFAQHAAKLDKIAKHEEKRK